MYKYHTHFKFKTCFLCSVMRDNWIYVINYETTYAGWIWNEKIVFYNLWIENNINFINFFKIPYFRIPVSGSIFWRSLKYFLFGQITKFRYWTINSHYFCNDQQQIQNIRKYGPTIWSNCNRNCNPSLVTFFYWYCLQHIVPLGRIKIWIEPSFAGKVPIIYHFAPC